MHLEEFAEGKSFFHTLDPRIKFLTFIPYIMVIAIVHGLRIPITALALSSIMAVLAELNKKKLLNRLIVVNIFVLMLWLFIPFSYPGEEFFRIGPLTASKEGFLYVLSITMKTNAIVLATIAILGTSEVFSLAHAFVHLKVPNKLVHLFFFFYRYISVLHEEYTRLKRAMIIRSFKPGTNLHTYRSFAYLIGMLLVNSYERSQRIYNAMLCRGFTGKFPVIDHFSLRKSDITFGLLMSVVTLILIYIM
ncbi:nickel transport protein NikQ [bacterium BMS3Abin10]|nr:nickel transport protein NikQ [bacterium BMS3Abin10]HDH53088.1 cobalt ECF transporter T component CbiQ [Nitrospirota bacterium]